jgi:hypothetical protein
VVFNHFSFSYDGHFVATVDYEAETATLLEALPDMDAALEAEVK